MYREMPDHPAASWPIGKSVAVALKIEKPDDLASFLGHQLDSRLLVALLLALDRVEERGVEERQHAAPQPALLVAFDVWANHDAHATSLAGHLRRIKMRMCGEPRSLAWAGLLPQERVAKRTTGGWDTRAHSLEEEAARARREAASSTALEG